MEGMRRKNRQKNGRHDSKEEGTEAIHSGLAPDTKKSVYAIVAFTFAALFILSFIGKGGNVGGYIYSIFGMLLGSGYFFVPLSFILIGFSLLFAAHKRLLRSSILGGVLFLLSSLAGLHILFGVETGGIIGALLGSPLLSLFDFWAGIIIVTSLFLISFLIMFNLAIWKESDKSKKEEDKENEEKEDEKITVQAVLNSIKDVLKTSVSTPQAQNNSKVIIDAALPLKEETNRASLMTEEMTKEKEEMSISLRRIAKKIQYKKPPLELLQGDRGTPSSGDIRANANIIKRTLENFSIDVEMGEVSIGPTVTQYTLRPAEGVKLSRITALHNDLSLALAAHPIRIEAPIPGKSLVGIEVPNRSIALVGLRALVEHKIFQEATQPLLLTLGRDVTGAPVFADLAKMPHLLISGATGAGKSVSVHSIITSFIYRNPPEILRFVLVDPKRVELSVYNDIPHLLTPVITDAKKTIKALRWATREMDRRYDLLSLSHLRDIASFNAALGRGSEGDLMPYIVIIIDELADLMAMFPREVESSIIRLAQMARAVGIHLIVATQRPSVEVITGLIKANITSRIAFQVASQVDSRTIIDMAGAEKLLGNGDMLFLAGDTAKPRRIQGAFLSEQEVKRVVGFLREEFEAPEYEHEDEILETKIDESNGKEEEFLGVEDPLYAEAKTTVLEAGKASASYLQRRLRVGYARAARLLDLMETRGIIGPQDGAKPREILAKHEVETSDEVFET